LYNPRHFPQLLRQVMRITMSKAHQNSIRTSVPAMLCSMKTEKGSNLPERESRYLKSYQADCRSHHTENWFSGRDVKKTINWHNFYHTWCKILMPCESSYVKPWYPNFWERVLMGVMKSSFYPTKEGGSTHISNTF